MLISTHRVKSAAIDTLIWCHGESADGRFPDRQYPPRSSLAVGLSPSTGRRGGAPAVAKLQRAIGKSRSSGSRGLTGHRVERQPRLSWRSQKAVSSSSVYSLRSTEARANRSLVLPEQ